MALVSMGVFFPQNTPQGVSPHLKVPAKTSDGPALGAQGDDQMLKFFAVLDIQSHHQIPIKASFFLRPSIRPLNSLQTLSIPSSV